MLLHQLKILLPINRGRTGTLRLKRCCHGTCGRSLLPPTETGRETAVEENQQPRSTTPRRKCWHEVREIAQGEHPQRMKLTIWNHIQVTHLQTVMPNRKEYIDGGSDPRNMGSADDDEETFKAKWWLSLRKTRQTIPGTGRGKSKKIWRNLRLSKKIKAMATSPDETNKSYQEFKDLQQQWKEIKTVPGWESQWTWRNYQLYVEQFYDYLKLNSETKEYDFKEESWTENQTANLPKLVDERCHQCFHLLGIASGISWDRSVSKDTWRDMEPFQNRFHHHQQTSPTALEELRAKRRKFGKRRRLSANHKSYFQRGK